MRTSAAATALTSAQAADAVPFPTVLTSAEHGWDSVALYRFRQPPSFVVDAPAARDHSLKLQISGRVLVEGRCDGRSERQWSDSGRIALTPAGLPVTRTIKGRGDFLLIHLAPALVDEVVQEFYGRDPAHVSLVECMAVPDKGLDRLGRLLLAEAEAREPGTRLAADALARLLALRLLRRHSSLASCPPPSLPSPGALADWRLRRVVEHMHAHLDGPLSLACLAAVGGLSPTQFARAFRAATRESPHRHLVRLRVERARELLEHTELPVTEIGLRCGFGQSSHFATMFRKFTGMSPRAWRQARST